MPYSGKSILITGGTGSFGNAFVRHITSDYSPSKVVVLSRDEMKQWQMAKAFQEDPRVRFFIGDVRDKSRLERAFEGIDYVVHAAASKIVPIAEQNPFEAVKTNVIGAMNLIDAALDQGVEKVVALSTDKASSPVNLYGATKLASDKMVVAGNNYRGSRNVAFSVVRYGNVLGSRGSVVPYFLELAGRGEPLRITDEKMTRFLITLEQGISLVDLAFSEMTGGEIFVKKIPSMSVLDIAEAIDPGGQRIITGVRPGEKIHEQMISEEDSFYTWEFDDHFRIVPTLEEGGFNASAAHSASRVEPGFRYASNLNSHWMSKEQLVAWLEQNEIRIREQTL